MLEIKNLHAKIEDGDKEILKGINLEIKPGEVHAIMGPNGAGKSTLSSVIAGKEDYEVTGGEIIFSGENIIEDAPEERAHKGIFLSFQYPVEIPGVSVTNFIKAAMNENRKANGFGEMPAKEMLAMIREKSEKLGIKKDFLSRSLNEGFSGGEKKRNEIFQMMMLNPKLAILDETDSGLDIDALRIVADGVNAFKNEGNAVLLITHYQRLLNYIQPDFVHVLANGKIIKTGDKSLALELEEKRIRLAPELIRYLKFEILGTINNFEDLEIWKDARHFCKMIYQNCLQNDKFQKYDKSQTDRASSSIMDNITEGFERKGNREFINFLTISKGSCGEVRSQESEPMTANTLMKNIHNT